MASGIGYWSFHVVPHLINCGAIDGPMAAGKKTLQRLRWLFIVAQLGGISTQRYCIKLGNAILLEEDLFSESNTDDSEESDEWSEQSQWARFHDQQHFEEILNSPPAASLGSQSD